MRTPTLIFPRLTVLPYLILCVSLGLIGCTTPARSGNPDSPPDAAVEMAQGLPTQGQSLPITAAANINGERIQLEVAATPQQQATGLMFREVMPPDRGMLFLFDPPRPVQFWMKNVSISLDMVFLRDGNVVAIAADVPPCTTPTCPTYGPRESVDQVLELAAGRAAELEIAVGDAIAIDPIAE